MSYITGYKVDVQDELPPEVLHYIHVGKNEYLTPVQMMCLLQWVRDRRKYDNPKLFHRFRDFVHKDEFMFPGLVINNEMALKYNIPVEMINMEKIKDTKLLQQEIDRIFEMQEDYYDNYKVGQDGLKTQYYAMERGRKPKVPLPGYMSSAADIAMRNRLLVEAQNKSLQARVASIEKESRENEEKVKADLLAKEEKDKLIERLRNLDPPEPPFKYDRNANRLHIPEPGKIPAPNFLIPQCLMQTILDKYKFGMNPNIINTMRRYYVDRSREIESKLVETYKDALGYRYDRKMSPTVQMVNGSQRPLGYYYYLYTGEELGRHMANGRVSCTIKSVEDMKTWLESKLVHLESNQK